MYICLFSLNEGPWIIIFLDVHLLFLFKSGSSDLLVGFSLLLPKTLRRKSTCWRAIWMDLMAGTTSPSNQWPTSRSRITSQRSNTNFPRGQGRCSVSTEDSSSFWSSWGVWVKVQTTIDRQRLPLKLTKTHSLIIIHGSSRRWRALQCTCCQADDNSLKPCASIITRTR